MLNANVWRLTNAFFAGLRPVRFSIGVLVLGALLWTQADQSQDILTAAAGSWGWWHWLKFGLSTLLWAWATWWFGRYLSAFDLGLAGLAPGNARRLAEAVADWSPRIIGTAVGLVVAYALKLAADNAATLASESGDTLLKAYAQILRRAEYAWIGGALLFLIFVWKRRWIVQKIKGAARPTPMPRGLTRAQQGGANSVIAAAAGLAAALYLAVILDPVFVGNEINSANTYGIGFASILGGLGLLASFADPVRLPLLRILLAWAIVVGLTTSDNHEMRTTSEPPPAKQYDLKTALDAWAAQQPSNAPPTLILLATAGGGIRAAYWTDVVLQNLTMTFPQISNQLFAISGVSGGSVGASIYAALLADCFAEVKAPCSSDQIRERAEATLKADLLAPPLMTLLYPDLLQNFLPFKTPDRAISLEKALEASYRLNAKTDRLHTSFLSLPHAGGWQPLLVLNSTSVQTGERVIVSPLASADWSSAVDFMAAHPSTDLFISTAANDSARFPLLEPPGRLSRGKNEGDDQVMDGGIYENFGATTLVDLLRGILKDANGQVPRILVIQISSDPDLVGGKAEPGVVTPAVRMMPDISGPILALLGSRTARGIDAAAILEHTTNDLLKERGCYVHFRMLKIASEAAPPLGWVLSDRAILNIDHFWEDDLNKQELKKLSRFLGGDGCKE